MTAPVSLASDSWYRSVEKTSQTDDERIQDITVLPPPEHLIRFFPIRGTEVETLIGQTRACIRRIMHGEDDRLLVIIGPCSIHSPEAALDYARRLQPLRELPIAHAFVVPGHAAVGGDGQVRRVGLDRLHSIQTQILMRIIIDCPWFYVIWQHRWNHPASPGHSPPRAGD